MGKFNRVQRGTEQNDVHVKVVKFEKKRKVGIFDRGLGPGLVNVSQELYGDVTTWAWLDHPNILQCFGITANPFQVVTEWLPDGDVIEYVQACLNADRVCLVGSLAHPPQGFIVQYLQIVVDRRGPGTQLPPLARYDTQGLRVCQSHPLDFVPRGTVLMNLVKRNVLVDSAGRARLSDIGFATFAHKKEPKTGVTGCSTHGSRWTAPEVSKDSEFSKQSDVFSLGFVAAEVRSQRCPPPVANINHA